MPSHSVPPSFRIAKAIGWLSAILVCQGFYCGEKPDPLGLPGAALTDIHLEIKDPATRQPGIFLAWNYPDGAHASYFEIFQSLDRDSLKQAALQPADLQHIVLTLSDTTSRPFTLYFGVRAVWVEPTGQKRVSDSMPIDSITITPSLHILQPSPGTYKPGRALNMEVQIASDPGVLIRFSYYEQDGAAWKLKQTGCMPLDPCPSTPLFGNSVQRDSLTLEQLAPTDTVRALFCVVGTESFQEEATGQMQSLGCTGFSRVGQ
jgi:hypothetical protein